MDFDTDEKPFAIDRAKQGRASCKQCKQKCETGELRIAKLTPSPYGSGKMKNWHHVDCLIEQFLKQRVNTKRIESIDEFDGFDNLNEEDRLFIVDKLNDFEHRFAQNHNLKSPRKLEYKAKVESKEKKTGTKTDANTSNKKSPKRKNLTDKQVNATLLKKDANSKDSQFKEFRRLVADITNESSYLKKSKLIENMFRNGSSGNGFTSDVTLWCRLLLPGVDKRVYNLKSKQLIKLFSRLFHTRQEPMLDHLKNGDVSDTIQTFFEENKVITPTKKSTLTLDDVDEFLQMLSTLTKEEDQIQHFKEIIPKCTSGDLKVIIRLIKQDLRMNAGAKHVLDGIHPDAYEMYQSSRDLDTVIGKCLRTSFDADTNIKANVVLMTPVLPMLAQACKSIEEAMKKCPNGIFSEIKYDGERVQVHKKGTEFRYFSRSLKPVLAHKIQHFKQYIPKAFPHAHDLILDSEILMIDTLTSKPLPFGTLGIHKKSEFKDATVCLFVFDCIYYNGEDLTKESIKTRKKILRENMSEIPNHVMFSEMEEIRKYEDLSKMMKRVLCEGLEGIVLKDTLSIYQPGKRHWLKIKKDYLFDGAMADSADLIVLGAWYGTGKKGGMMSTFLMGCYDKTNKVFVTVTKVHTGLDDETLEKLQKELQMVKISCDYSRVPDWLNCNKNMTPDFVAKDPKKQPVWQIIGAEFTQHEVHTANGISIRFPRIVKMRDDKDWESATNLEELHHLMDESQRKTSKILNDNLSINSDQTETNLEDTRTDEGSNINIEGLRSAKRGLDSPEKSNKKVKRETVQLENPIPRYFDGIKLCSVDNIQSDLKIWLRYFIAYGGTVLDVEHSDEATHILHVNEEIDICYKCPKLAEHVHLDWIKETVAKKTLQECRNYPVWLQPNCNESDECELPLSSC